MTDGAGSWLVEWVCSSDASFASQLMGRSVAGGFHYMGNQDDKEICAGCRDGAGPAEFHGEPLISGAPRQKQQQNAHVCSALRCRRGEGRSPWFVGVGHPQKPSIQKKKLQKRVVGSAYRVVGIRLSYFARHGYASTTCHITFTALKVGSRC